MTAMIIFRRTKNTMRKKLLKVQLRKHPPWGFQVY
jgi:hypothetical protein